MIETLTAVDSLLFIGINQTLANPVTDFVMPIITNDMVLRIGYALALALIFWKGSAPLRWLAVGSLFAVIVSDLSSSSLLKPLIDRARPCHDPQIFENLRLLVGCGGGRSLPSSHAANAFAVASAFWLSPNLGRYRSLIRWGLFSVAALIAVSRTFVGVHYPLDVLSGACLGVLCGALGWKLIEISRPGQTREIEADA